jgi:hypothetical protein
MMIGRYTDVRDPPVVRLYHLEALIQLVRSRGRSPHLEGFLVREFERGMRQDMSGCYADGGVRSRFRFSVGNPHRRGEIALTLSPLSRYEPSRLGAAPVTVQWESSGGEQGTLILLENGLEQRFVISLGASVSAFVHVTCWSDYRGTSAGRDGRLPACRIIGFLDSVEA